MKYGFVAFIGLIILGLSLLTPLHGYAADYAHGDACSSPGAFHQRNDASGMDFLICDGSNWKSSIYFSSAGNNWRIDDDPAESGAGCFRYDGANNKLQYSDDCSTFQDIESGGGSGDGGPATWIGLDPATWPDEILCNTTDESNTAKALLRLIGYGPTGGWALYEVLGDGNETYVAFDPTTGAYIGSGTNIPGTSTYDCSGNSIQQLVANGQGFWFGGGSGSGGGLWSQGAGDDIYYNSGAAMVGIGKADPTAALDVVGDISYTGGLNDVSDIRLKDNIVPLDSTLDQILKLQAISFTMKDDAKGRTEYGFSAQQMLDIFPALVRTANDDNKTLSVNYVGLIAPMTRAIQEQQALVEAQQSEIEALKARLEALERFYGTGRPAQK